MTDIGGVGELFNSADYTIDHIAWCAKAQTMWKRLDFGSVTNFRNACAATTQNAFIDGLCNSICAIFRVITTN